MTATQIARRSDALYADGTCGITRRVLCDMVAQRESDLENAKAESAKLRELCAGLWSVMWACAEQRCPHRYEDCFVVSGNGSGPKGHGECWYKQRMRELGIEVTS